MKNRENKIFELIRQILNDFEVELIVIDYSCALNLLNFVEFLHFLHFFVSFFFLNEVLEHHKWRVHIAILIIIARCVQQFATATPIEMNETNR